MTPEAKAIEAARECAMQIFHPASSIGKLQMGELTALNTKEISKSLSLPQLFAIVEAAEETVLAIKSANDLTGENWKVKHKLENTIAIYHTAQKENRGKI